MSVSTYAVGIKPPDEDYLKMKAVFDTCKAVKINPPVIVWEFFDDCEPDERGVVVELPKECCKEYSEEGEVGIIVDLTKIPKGVKLIKFVNSY